jgi:hypothetical protein
MLGRCGWDSFALPHLLPDQGPMLVATTCPACDRAHAWRVDDREPPAGGQVAHFLVPATRMWDDVVYPCGNQRIFCSEACVATWLNESGHQRGSVLDLQTLWRLAAGWYAGRLERGFCPPRAERCRRTTWGCRALRRLLGPHLGVIDGGLPWVFR